MKNINSILVSNGSNFNNVFKSTVFLKDMNRFAEFDEIYKKYFTSGFPAWATVEVSRLPKDALIEIQVDARLV